ncbi:unnamed protein product [Didymodactylos carnosus]|uniref:ribonuclease H n=1 Tax=Didymodactylos carnosus TaxID=1234261 RepID=A0A813TKN5_9BILA|nr:unnamed protein product [Didymodactylos carnosus]CAF3599893.1 unnamed protein product [Didymodactylos carnosus]
MWRQHGSRRIFEWCFESFTTVYTDGCCLSNGQKESRAGYGVYWEDNHPWNVSEHLDGPPTNNRAELMGSITAMEIALLNGISDLEIKTDSQYTIDAATKYIQNWKKQNWIKKLDSTPVLNKDLMEKLDNLQQQLNVKWTYVKGHSNDRGNDAADKLAKAGATKV